MCKQVTWVCGSTDVKESVQTKESVRTDKSVRTDERILRFVEGYEVEEEEEEEESIGKTLQEDIVKLESILPLMVKSIFMHSR
ncbi:hypothetical protein VNO80_27432 [Phaseolus coccineus]|uniref:Uncharacterized protein n=1 Tax=Phaseolus coccineus TaxID=3886 RepID=A0AAN9LGK6_PHACN